MPAQIKKFMRLRTENQEKYLESDVNDFLATILAEDLIKVEFSYPIVMLNTTHTDSWNAVNNGRQEWNECVVYYKK